jgi:TnpA family transposase
LSGVDRRDLSWVNQQHITEEKLDEAIRAVIAAYNRFQLPKFWGTGKRASADGTKWEIFEQNLLAEYYIRYGGYGGIGYYHVSDTYIALFSHFIPCGVWEGSYILDMFAKRLPPLGQRPCMAIHKRRVPPCLAWRICWAFP